MNTRLRHSLTPRLGMPVEVGVIDKALCRPEVAAEVLHPRLHPALSLGSVGMAQPRSKAETAGEVQKPWRPERFTRFPSQHDQLGVVVEALLGDATQPFEGVQVTAEKRGEVGPPDELH